MQEKYMVKAGQKDKRVSYPLCFAWQKHRIKAKRKREMLGDNSKKGTND